MRSSRLAGVSDLQWAHLMSVPFENLTIHLGGRNVLDLERNYEKIVRRAARWVVL